MGKRLTKPEILRLAAESARDPKTVERVLKGAGNEQSRAAVTAAARRLDIVLPEKPK
jgi:hypothetical protein